MFHLNVRSIPKNIDKVTLSRRITFKKFQYDLLLNAGFAIITFLPIMSMDTLTYLKLEERTNWDGVFQCLLTAE